LDEVVVGNIGLHLYVRIPAGVGHLQAILALTVVSAGQSCHHYLTQQITFFLLWFATHTGVVLLGLGDSRAFGFFLDGFHFYFLFGFL